MKECTKGGIRKVKSHEENEKGDRHAGEVQDTEAKREGRGGCEGRRRGGGSLGGGRERRRGREAVGTPHARRP